MSASALVVGCASAGMAAAGSAALVAPPTRRLAPRVRPYTLLARTRLGHSADVVPAVRAARREPASTIGRLLWPLWLSLRHRAGRLAERRSDDALETMLRHAHYVGVTPDDYRSRVALEMLVFAGAGAVFGALLVHSSIVALGLTLCGAVFGASRTRGRLERAIVERRDRIRLELYTVNQLLAMHIRTGAGPVQATQRVVDRGKGAVIEELDDVLAALHHGVVEPEAFRHAAEITPEPAAARTYKLFAVGAELGVDLADGLRALSEDLRDARREELRRTATKRRAAMLVPTIAVLAPVMLLFIAAPLPSIVFGGR